MATQKPDQFDQINWDDMAQTSRLSVSTNTKLFLAAAVPILALAVYDWQFVGEREAMFTQLGAVLGLSGAFETVGLTFDLNFPLDYLFALTIALFVSYVLLSLYQSPRMTMMYWQEFRKNRPAVLSLVWIGIVFVGGIIGPVFIDPPTQDVLARFQPPKALDLLPGVEATVNADNVPRCLGEQTNGQCHGTWEYPLGTTSGGKGLFAGVVHGMTITAQIAFITTSIVAALGITFGTVSAFAGGWVDEIMMRFTDVVLSFPTFVMFLLILYIYGGGVGMFILVFSLFAWGGMARYVRSKALSVSEEEFIKATKISGASRFRLVRKHLIPNTASSIVTQLTLSIPAFLLAEAQLAFLGLGDRTLNTWGQLISSGRDFLEFAPWITIIPGIVLFVTILAFNFVGDAILDAINPEAQAEDE